MASGIVKKTTMLLILFIAILYTKPLIASSEHSAQVKTQRTNRPVSFRDLHAYCFFTPEEKINSFFRAANQGYMPNLIKLLSWGLDINSKHPIDGAHVLHHAVHGECIKTVTYLLQSKADIQATNNQGFTPLHVAAQVGNYALARLLIEAQADIHSCTRHNIQPIHAAAWNNNPQVMQLFLDNGINPITRVNTNNNSPLHCAAQKGNPAIVHVLATHEYKQLLKNPEQVRVRILSIADTLANYLPPVLAPLIVNYISVEIEQNDGTLSDVTGALPSLLLLNKGRETPVACAINALKEKKNRDKKSDFEQCIVLLESPQAACALSVIEQIFTDIHKKNHA